ncbi:type IA DNA topoisomerase [Senegalia massiliensis]|uniref:DNA topoisomerase n=1 Tax=Senegalia massiliensis TaxID=1720316 RepID=A0A845R4X1_9CLOT|nr:DNA topoisomerase [Senegalia massiliensis]NBI07553.1 type IA DNA topoisomerase [Senegalia massiliensis]
MRLFIAEKSSVALNLARTLNCEKKNGYYEGNGNVITYARGHLLELKDSVDYDPSMEVWSLDKFPFIPEKYMYKIKTDRKSKKVDLWCKKQIGIIKKLINRDDVIEVVNAFDYDREGSLIFFLLNAFLGNKKKTYRMTLNEWTPDAIRSNISTMKLNSNYRNQEIAGLCRQQADWTLGINFTSVSTLKYTKGRGKYPLSIGRVILPTLKLIHDRDMEINNFVSKDYYELKSTFTTDKGNYDGTLFIDNNTKFNDKRILENIKNKITGKSAFIKDKKIETSNKNSPSLFNLNDLQGYITSKYNGWTADKVARIAQSLYEGNGKGGYISYTRTKSRHLESNPEFINKTEKVLEILKGNSPYKNDIKFHNKKTVFDSSKVDGHGAIIPTYIIPKELNSDEMLIYNEIKNRFLSQFMPPAKYENTKIITQIKDTDVLFKTTGRILISEGWLKLFDKDVQEDMLPQIDNGENVNVDKLNILTKQTKPPRHYTTKTLFETMENCGKKVDSNAENDSMLSNVLSGYEIGTQPTRASTLSKMNDIGYVKMKGKNILITDIGINLINLFPVKELMDVDFTGKLEKTLSDIEKGKFTKKQFMGIIKNLTIKGVNQIKQSEGVVIDFANEMTKNSVGSCPACSKPIVESKKGYGCSGWKEGCTFVIWKKNAFLSKFGITTITKKNAAALIENKDGVIFGIKGINIKTKVIKKNDKYELEFDVEKKQIQSLGKCPECNKNVVENTKAYTCEDRNCNFVIFKNDKFLAKFSKKPTKTMVKSLLNKNEFHMKNLKGEKGDFECVLKLKKNGKYWGYEMNYK